MGCEERQPGHGGIAPANKADVNAKDQLGETPLTEAAFKGHAAILKALIGAGADRDAITSDAGLTTLMFAIRGGNVDAVKVLLESGANVEARDNWRTYRRDVEQHGIDMGTPLVHAGAAGRPDVVRVLLDAGADKEATDYWGHTALSIAKQADNAEVVKLLLDAGATK
jgi:ankyrin repeat protein